MAVHRRTYQPYAGPVTPPGRRWLVLSRYALREILASRLLAMYLVAVLVPILIEAVIIYLTHNVAARALLHISETFQPIGVEFFYRATAIQGGFALFLVAAIGPTLIAPDLADGGLALYFSRPLTRPEYVAGKMSVLLGLLSLITWVPVVVLVGLETGLGGLSLGTALRLVGVTVAVSLLWAFLLSFLSVSIAAWVRWRLAATGLFFAVFMVGSGMGEAINATVHTRWGRLLNLNYLIDVIWRALYDLPKPQALPQGAAWAVLLACCLICVWLLDQRLRAKEVVR
jgi:ABC-2 type transport system permease protein